MPAGLHSALLDPVGCHASDQYSEFLIRHWRWWVNPSLFSQTRIRTGKYSSWLVISLSVWFLQMAALMIALFIGSWLPYALVATFGIVGLDQLVTPYSAELPVMLAKASAIWNPIVYALKHPRYRLALAERLPQWVRAKCCRCAQGDSQTSSTTRRSCVSQSQKPSAEPIAAQSTEDRVDLQVRQQIPAIVAASDDGGGNDTDVMWLETPVFLWHRVTDLVYRAKPELNSCCDCIHSSRLTFTIMIPDNRHKLEKISCFIKTSHCHLNFWRIIEPAKQQSYMEVEECSEWGWSKKNEDQQQCEMQRINW